MTPAARVVAALHTPTTLILALYDATHGPLHPLREAQLSAAALPALTQHARALCGAAPATLQRIVLVTESESDALTEEMLEHGEQTVPVSLLSPAEALGSAQAQLGPHDLEAIQHGRANDGAPQLSVAIGPGLSAGWLLRGECYRARPGYLPVAPTNYLETNVVELLQKQYGQVYYRHVCSPTGLIDLYAVLKEIGVADEPPWLSAQLLAAQDPLGVILAAAQPGRQHSTLCLATLECFAAFLGTLVGTLALCMETSAIYLGGELVQRAQLVLVQDWFHDAFLARGQMAPLLEAVPIVRITRPDVLLLGAATVGLAAVY